MRNSTQHQDDQAAQPDSDQSNNSSNHANTAKPPRWMRAIVRACVPHEDRHAMVHELDTMHAARSESGTRMSANWWYLRQMVGFLVRLAPLHALHSIGRWDSLSGDVRVASRFFRRNPGYVAAFAITLGIGAGVLSTVYTAANWVLLRPVPGIHDAGQLSVLRLGGIDAPPQVSFHVSQPDVQLLRERMRPLAEVAATAPVDVDVRVGNGEPTRMAGDVVSANYFSVLRATPAFGRGFTDDEERMASGGNVVVVSHAFARRQSREVSSIVGTDVRINGTRFQVVGVAPENFRGAELPGRADLWFPLSALVALDPSTSAGAATDRGAGIWRRMIVRQRAGVAVDAIAAAANDVMRAVRLEFKGQPHSYMANMHTFQSFKGIGLDPSVRNTVRRTLSLVALSCAFLMLLAVANLANLVLSQTGAREGATAVRVALGAGRARIARSQLVESALLGVMGGGVGLVLSTLWARWFDGAMLTEYGGSLQGMRMDFRVIAATMCIAVVAALLATARQAFGTRKFALERLLRVATARVSARMRAQMTLVSTQVALSFMLLVAAGLLGKTVDNLRSINLGFSPDRLSTFAIDPAAHGYERERLDQLGRQFEEQMRSHADIASAGLIAPSPLRSSYITGAIYGDESADAKPTIGAGFYISPGLLDALNVKVIAGEQHWRGDSGTVVITQTAAAKLYPGVPVEQIVGRTPPTRSKGKARVRIVAVIQDVQLSDITGAVVPTYFRPLRESFSGLTVSAFVRTNRTNRTSTNATASIQSAMQTVAPDVPIFAMQSARSAIDLQFSERKVMALAATTLGVLGATLAAIGLYGVLSSLVSTRQREFGIRSALGASPAALWRAIVLRGLGPTAIGIVVGLCGALAGSRVLVSMLYGLTPLDVRTYVTGVVALLVVAFVTCMIPAVRATRVAPAAVLRSE